MITVLIIILLSLATVVFAVKWIICWVSEEALVRYMRDKGYAPPSDKELRTYCYRALKKLFGIQ